MMGARASISTENSLLIPQTAGGDDVRASLIDSALGLLAEGGRGEFSLRKVAERIGASGSAASHRFGDRAGLVAEVAAAALTREAAQLAQFADRLPSLPPSIETLAPVLTEWLDQRARWGRTQTRICCELALMSYREPAGGDYGQALRRLYLDFLGRLCPALSGAAADLLAFYLLAESPNWLVLADDTGFRLLSGETARRVSALALGGDPQTSRFWLDWSAKRAGAALAHPAALTGTKARIAQAVAAIIAEEGAHAVTHRAIAKVANVSLSSLVHHFGKRTDLIRAGVELLFREGSDPSAPATFEEAARNSLQAFELALYALSDPFLAPQTAATRERLVWRRTSGTETPTLCEIFELLSGAALLLRAEDSAGAHALTALRRKG